MFHLSNKVFASELTCGGHSKCQSDKRGHVLIKCKVLLLIFSETCMALFTVESDGPLLAWRPTYSSSMYNGYPRSVIIVLGSPGKPINPMVYIRANGQGIRSIHDGYSYYV